MDDENAIIAGEGDLALAQQLTGEGAGDPQAEEGAEDTFEVELDGQVHTLPSALKGAFLRQADYTRKTQELAEHRRQAEVERRALAERRQAMEGADGDRAHLAALDNQLSGFAEADWEAIAQADPRRAQALWARFQETKGLRDHYAYALSHHEARGQLEAAREAAEQMAETGRTLQREIDGWSPEVANKLVEYAQAFGVTLEELSQMADPRLWKVLHRAYQADQATQQDGAAKSAAQAQAVRPAVLVSGAAAGGGGVRDELATKEWMARRNAQMTKAR
jgi:hypothetical protein